MAEDQEKQGQEEQQGQGQAGQQDTKQQGQAGHGQAKQENGDERAGEKARREKRDRYALKSFRERMQDFQQERFRPKGPYDRGFLMGALRLFANVGLFMKEVFGYMHDHIDCHATDKDYEERMKPFAGLAAESYKLKGKMLMDAAHQGLCQDGLTDLFVRDAAFINCHRGDMNETLMNAYIEGMTEAMHDPNISNEAKASVFEIVQQYAAKKLDGRISDATVDKFMAENEEKETGAQEKETWKDKKARQKAEKMDNFGQAVDLGYALAEKLGENPDAKAAETEFTVEWRVFCSEHPECSKKELAVYEKTAMAALLCAPHEKNKEWKDVERAFGRRDHEILSPVNRINMLVSAAGKTYAGTGKWQLETYKKASEAFDRYTSENPQQKWSFASVLAYDMAVQGNLAEMSVFADIAKRSGVSAEANLSSDQVERLTKSLVDKYDKAAKDPDHAIGTVVCFIGFAEAVSEHMGGKGAAYLTVAEQLSKKNPKTVSLLKRDADIYQKWAHDIEERQKEGKSQEHQEKQKQGGQQSQEAQQDKGQKEQMEQGAAAKDESPKTEKQEPHAEEQKTDAGDKAEEGAKTGQEENKNAGQEQPVQQEKPGQPINSQRLSAPEPVQDEVQDERAEKGKEIHRTRRAVSGKEKPLGTDSKNNMTSQDNLNKNARLTEHAEDIGIGLWKDKIDGHGKDLDGQAVLEEMKARMEEFSSDHPEIGQEQMDEFKRVAAASFLSMPHDNTKAWRKMEDEFGEYTKGKMPDGNAFHASRPSSRTAVLLKATKVISLGWGNQDATGRSINVCSAAFAQGLVNDPKKNQGYASSISENIGYPEGKYLASIARKHQLTAQVRDDSSKGKQMINNAKDALLQKYKNAATGKQQDTEAEFIAFAERMPDSMGGPQGAYKALRNALHGRPKALAEMEKDFSKYKEWSGRDAKEADIDER